MVTIRWPGFLFIGLFLAGWPGIGRASSILDQAEGRIERELLERLSLMSEEPEVYPQLDEAGRLHLEVVVPVARDADVAELRRVAGTVEETVAYHIGRHYPNVQLDPESVVKIRPPFTLEGSGPYVASFGGLFEDRRKAMAPPPPPDPLPAGRPSGGLTPFAVHGAVEARPSPSTPAAPATENPEFVLTAEATLLERLGDLYPLTEVEVDEAGPGMLRLRLVLEEMNDDRREVSAVMRQLVAAIPVALGEVAGYTGVAKGSEIDYLLVDPATRENLPGIRGTYGDGGWTYRNIPPPRPAGAPAVPPPAGPEPGTVRVVEETVAVPGAVTLEAEREWPEVTGRRIVHDELQDPDHLLDEPVSMEDLVHIPYPYTYPKGSMVLRLEGRARRLGDKNYSNLEQRENFDYETSITLAPLDRFQYELRFQRQRVNLDLVGVEKRDASAEALTVAMKYQLPVGRYLPHALMAIGADLSIRSREDEALRVLDDLVDRDSFWATIGYWKNPVWNLLLSLRHHGILGSDEYTSLALASEFILQAPLRRAWIELVVRDLADRDHSYYGRRLMDDPFLDLGVEFALGDDVGLVFQNPHAFSSQNREGVVNLYMRY